MIRWHKHIEIWRMKFDACAKSEYSKLQQRLFFLRKLNSFYVDKTILQLFYQSVVQSILALCLVCVFGNMRTNDRIKLERIVKKQVK